MKTTRNYQNYHKFILKLIRHVDFKYSISFEAKDILNQIINYIINKYIQNSIELTFHGNKNIIDFDTISTLTTIWFDNYKEYIDFAEEKLKIFKQNKIKYLKKHQKAELLLPSTRIHNLFDIHKKFNQKISEKCYIYLTAIVEYLLFTIIKETISISKKLNKFKITGQYIYLALNQRKDIALFLKNTIIAGFGYIGDFLLSESQQNHVQFVMNKNSKKITSHNNSNKIDI